MKRFATLLAVVCLLAGAAFTQQTPVPNPPSHSSFTNGTFYAPNFGKWQLQVANTIAASGTSILVNAGYTTTPDGIQFVPFAAKEKINVGTGSTAEIATISAVSGCNQLAAPGTTATCTLTVGALSNAHSIGEPITSADNGIIEAVAYAQQAGGGQVKFLVDCGVITLSTSSATTTSSCFVPNLFFNQGSASRVTTTITTATGWEVGVTGALATFSTNNTTLTAGTTAFTTQGTPAVALVTSATASDLAAVIVTAAGSAAGAGAIHVKVWGYTPAQPAY